jgi:cadmium resistance protein CadD (predicted permease)
VVRLPCFGVLLVLSAVAVFAGTNIDDLIVLTTLFAAGVAPRAIVVGQYLGVALLVGVSLIAGLALGAFPDRWIGLFGLIPLALGIRALRHREHGTPQIVTTQRGVVGVTVANGADNVSVYTPIFAKAGITSLAYVPVFAVLVAVWLVAARWLATRGPVARTLDGYGHWIVPGVFLTVGALLIVTTIRG